MCTSRLHQVVGANHDGRTVVRDLNGAEHTVSLLAVEGDEPAAGDWLVVHSGFALTRAEPGDVEAALADWESIKTLSAHDTASTKETLT